ncbi:hypothetical protein EFB08_04555 [Rufibacter latericius]|uniref:Uncharacterized protein n=1 Tax=Rufibacter latericius TaxID=2487040 RepID=A0A3M9MYB7_9BACT|nr:hypothetical protein EFB08_04555 [Rufibacter latericius]
MDFMGWWLYTVLGYARYMGKKKAKRLQQKMVLAGEQLFRVPRTMARGQEHIPENNRCKGAQE